MGREVSLEVRMDPHDAAVEAARLAMIESLRDCFGQPFGKIDVQRFRDAVRAGIIAFQACKPARVTPVAAQDPR